MVEFFMQKVRCAILCYERFNETMVFKGQTYLMAGFPKRTDIQSIRNVADKMLTLLSEIH